MKRIVVILILMSYSIASFGVSLNYFYCCGKLETISLAFTAEKTDCVSKPDKGCCNNKIVTLQLKTDQKNSEQPIFHFAAPISTAFLYTDHFAVATPANVSGKLFYKRPPTHFPSRNILFCVFRI